ncbi:M24 family metallopeptidase [Caldalkalibacillus salinus]|uniref:M24 family metallopeptidase n=1 Tax=Caldalkalibacillus salinus TaxID=2803787 RepID=UPI001920878C|nr:aminopeptidase P family N-terminal domain-containing protein [Caldalkalibacillus salinus]
MLAVDHKVDQLRQILKEENKQGVLLTQQKNVSWLTGGRSFINVASEVAVASVLITDESVTLVTNNIEKQRLLEEEMSDMCDKVEVFPWYTPEEREAWLNQLMQQEIIVDTDWEKHLFPLRTVMDAKDLPQIRHLGITAAEAIEATAFQLKRGQTEYEIAGLLAQHCLSREIEPIVTLVAADERVYTRRHPLPTSKKLDRYVMLVLCARRAGRIMSVTRLVHFGSPTQDLLQRHEAVALVDSHMIVNTTLGRPFSELFDIMKAAYTEVGFQNEWQHHHQGGLSGYSTREALLLPQSTHNVQLHQVYAWNPSVPGAKSEDTILVEDKGIPHLLTYTNQFPYETFEVGRKEIKRPAILVRKAH